MDKTSYTALLLDVAQNTSIYTAAEAASGH